QHEPGVARTLADTAICDRLLRSVHALAAVYLAQLIGGFESAVIVAGFSPRNAARPWDVAAALAGFGKSGRREDFTRELLRASNVVQCRGTIRKGCLHLRQERADREIRVRCFI